MDYKIVNLPPGYSIENFVQLGPCISFEAEEDASSSCRPAIGAKVMALLDIDDASSSGMQYPNSNRHLSFVNDIQKLEVGDVLYSIDGRVVVAAAGGATDTEGCSFDELRLEVSKRPNQNDDDDDEEEESSSAYSPNLSTAMLTLVFESCHHPSSITNEAAAVANNSQRRLSRIQSNGINDCSPISSCHAEELSLSSEESSTSFYSAGSFSPPFSKSYCTQGETPQHKQQQQLLQYNLSAIPEEGYSSSICVKEMIVHQTPHPFNGRTQNEQCANEISPLGLSFVESPATPCSAVDLSREAGVNVNTSVQSTRSFSSRGVSMDMLDFGYVSQCTSPSKLRLVVEALAEDPLKYPSLYKLASDRLLRLEQGISMDSKESVFSLQYTPSQKSGEMSSLYFTPTEEFATTSRSSTSCTNASKQQSRSPSKRNQPYKHATRPFNMANIFHDLDLNSSHISPVSSFDEEEEEQDISGTNSKLDNSQENMVLKMGEHSDGASELNVREECPSKNNTSIDELHSQISAIRERLNECTSSISAASMSKETSFCSLDYARPQIFHENQPQSIESSSNSEMKNHMQGENIQAQCIVDDAAENSSEESLSCYRKTIDELTSDLENARSYIEKLKYENGELQDIAKQQKSGKVYRDQDFVFKSQLVIAQSAVDAMARELAVSQIDLQQMMNKLQSNEETLSTLRAEKADFLKKMKKLDSDLSASNAIIASLRAKEMKSSYRKCNHNTPPRPVKCQSVQTTSSDNEQSSITSEMSERRQHFRSMKLIRTKSLVKSTPRDHTLTLSEAGASISSLTMNELETHDKDGVAAKEEIPKNTDAPSPRQKSNSEIVSRSPREPPQAAGGSSCSHVKNLQEQCPPNAAALVSPEGPVSVATKKTPVKLCLDIHASSCNQDENKHESSSPSVSPISGKSKVPMKKSMLLRKKNLLMKYEQSRRRLSPLTVKNR